MVFLKNDAPALILIDIQKGFDDVDYWGGNRNNPDAENNASRLLNFWRKNSWPVFYLKHCSTNLNSPLAKGQEGNEIKNIVKPMADEPVIEKNVNSAFIGTDLKLQLEKAEITKLVFVGLTTDHCVSTSVRMAGNYGFETYVVFDATATFDKKGLEGQVYPAELIHETALASLNEEFATVIKTSYLIEMLGGK